MEKGKHMKKIGVFGGIIICVLTCFISIYTNNMVVEAVDTDFTIADGVLTAYTGTDTNVIIPEGVTEIGSAVFQNNTIMETVQIPDTVTTIGMDAFYGCTSLKELELPDSVTKIGDTAFSGCTGLTKVSLSANLSNAGFYSFSGCIGLTEVEIPKRLSSANAMFRRCNNLKKVTFEEGATWIATGLFSDCDGLEEITIPETVESIPAMCFELCDNLRKVVLPPNIKTVAARAFYGTAITEMELPIGTEGIGDSAFGNCTELVKVTIPYTVTAIDADAFDGTENVVIYCYKNSYAEEFAIQYEIEYVADDVKVEEVILSETELLLEIDDSVLLKATITPEGYSDEVVWTTSDMRVARISEYGRVTARRIGTTDITVTAGECSAVCKVTVVRSKATPTPAPTVAPTPEPTVIPTATPVSTATPKPSTPKAQVRAFVERMYTCALGRAAEEEGAEYWANCLLAGSTTGAIVADGFINGPEFIGRCLTDRDYVLTLYATFFDREAAEADIEFWVSSLKSVSRRQVMAGFVNSPEFGAICESYGIIRGSISAEGSSAPTEIALNTTELSIRVGEVKKLTVLNYGGEISWSNRTGSVVVDGEGNVTGATPGTDYVNAIYDGQSLMCTITVLNTTAADWVYSEDGNTRTRTNYLGEVITEVKTVVEGEEVWGYYHEEYAERWREYIQEIRRSTRAGIADGMGDALGVVNPPDLIMRDSLDELAKRRAAEDVCGIGTEGFEGVIRGAYTPEEVYEILCDPDFSRNLLGAIMNPDFVYGGVTNFWWDRMGTGVDLYPYWFIELDLYHADEDGADDLQWFHCWEIFGYSEDGHTNYYCRDGQADEGHRMFCGLVMEWNPQRELYEFKFVDGETMEFTK